MWTGFAQRRGLDNVLGGSESGGQRVSEAAVWVDVTNGAPRQTVDGWRSEPQSSQRNREITEGEVAGVWI